MVITKDRAVQGIAEFMRLDLIPLMPQGIARFASNMALVAFRSAPDQFIAGYMPFLKMVGVVGEDGNTFDVDAFANYSREAMAEAKKVTIGGFTLDINDLNNLIGRLQ